MTTKDKGDITELSCLLAFMQHGIHVAIPYGENVQYDIVADIGNKLYRIQCKSSTYKNGAISFSCKTTHLNTKKTSVGLYTGKIDFYMTCYNSKYYLIPIEECQNSSCKALRIDKPKTNQIKGISYAEDYELSVILHKMLA